MFLDTIVAALRQPPARKTSGKPPAKVRQKSVPTKSPATFGNDAIYLALDTAARRGIRALSISELADAMGCSIGESSKRVKAAGVLVTVTKAGRKKLVSLRRDLSWPEWRDTDATLSPGVRR